MGTSTTPTITTYVSDMLALERHIAQPLEHQSQDDAVAKNIDASRVIREAHRQVVSHIDALEQRLAALGGHPASGLKSGVATATGAIAAAVGDARKTEVSKYLRDDYSALALASASYTMLHTTALALGDTTTATLAQRHLADVATSVMRISKTLPITVLKELRAEGAAVDPTVLGEAERDVHDAWREGGARSEN
jgi:ferritin-like metal-binding protein YciE